MFFYLLFYSKVYYQIQTIFKTLQLTSCQHSLVAICWDIGKLFLRHISLFKSICISGYICTEKQFLTV